MLNMDGNGKNTKISGYLEKKGKHKVIGAYKKYWFVLEGGLLLYYRSKVEYDTISTFKGCINLGPPCNIKPLLSTTGAFQLQTRTGTITLKAVSREEQNRWMQAIMSEINPNKIQPKMSHFRYSLDELPQSRDQTESQNKKATTSEEKSEAAENPNDTIIQRLQKMGAQSYGNPPIGNIINKIATARKQHSDEVQNNFEHMYSDIVAEIRPHSEPVYEKVSNQSQMTNHYDIPVTNIQEDITKVLSLPGKGFNTLRIKSAENRPITFILENDTYAVSIKQKELTDQSNTRKPTEEETLVENDIYASTMKNNESVIDGEVFVINDQYSETLNTKLDITRDHNENVTTRTSEENIYSVPDTGGVQNGKENNEKECVEYCEPQCLEEIKRKAKKEKKTKQYKEKNSTENNKNHTKLKKRPSFIRRVWKKKDKPKETGKNEVEDKEENVYETVRESVVEKIAISDGKTVQILSELHNILEQKVPVLIHKLNSDASPPTASTMSDTSSEATNESNRQTEQSISHNKQSESTLPTLPLKNRNLEHSSPFHDIPRSNKPIGLPPKRNRCQTINEILQELDNQKQEEKNKVKKLIKRFSEPEYLEGDVVLRTSKKVDFQRKDINSDELSRLLEELAKVTNAPLLTPGVTSSLDGSNIENVEFSTLLPVRRRRYSEPDYDIPRPHKSLTIISKRDDPSENAIGSTRFFGPILKPSDIPPNVNTWDYSSKPPSQLNSITPDSLEADTFPFPLAGSTSLSTNKDRTLNDSNHYFKFVDKSYNRTISDKIILPRTDQMVDNDIYHCPKSIQRSNLMVGAQKKVQGCDHDEDGVSRDAEVFVDSLESGNNNTTELYKAV